MKLTPMKSKFSILTVAMAFGLVSVIAVSSNKAFAASDDDDSTGHNSFVGPSIHAAIGIRSKKAPDLDTYYSTVGGLKLSPFSIDVGTMYFSLLCPGLHYAGYGIFAPSISPVIFNHAVGVGFAADFFPVRSDRLGGPVGLSLNLDIVRLAQTIMAATGK